MRKEKKMKWRLVHTDIAIKDDSSVISKTAIVLEKGGSRIVLGEIKEQENHVFGSKRVLVDTANMLKRLAHEMENKADSIK